MCGIGSDWIHEAQESSEGGLLPEHKPDRALIIFIKNPVKGRVKTRLAKTMGDAAALEAYHIMLAHTREIAAQVNCHRAVFYSDFMDASDAWTPPTFAKYVQATGDLGEKMQSAFVHMFAEGYKKVLIIGSDLLDLQVQHLEHGFRALEHYDYVVGPASDGGYYLLGMKAVEPTLFEDKNWSTATVLSDTLKNMQDLGKTSFLLPELNDIDEENDWHEALARYRKRLRPT